MEGLYASTDAVSSCNNAFWFLDVVTPRESAQNIVTQRHAFSRAMHHSWYLKPLRKVGLPIDKWLFQLLLALRFIPLVQEELQNLARSLSTRAINFRKLGIKSSISIFLSLGERLLINILLRAEQGADALLARNGGLVLKPLVFKAEDVANIRTFCLNLISTFGLVGMLYLRNKYVYKRKSNT